LPGFTISSLSVDAVKPLKYEADIHEIDYYETETDPKEDAILARGLVLTDSAVAILRRGSSLVFIDQIAGSKALSDLGSSGITEVSHEGLETLTHNLARNNFEEIKRNNNKISSVIYWKTTGSIKIRDEIIYRNNNRASRLIYRQYSTSIGNPITKTMTGIIQRANNDISSITWTAS
jgi:hypothetical protein